MSGGEFLFYQAPDGTARIQVRLEDRTLWLTQQQLADLYESTPQNITQHIRAIYAERELVEAATCKPYLQVRSEAGRQVSRSLKHYNLDVVIAIGYRVRSHRGTQFRRWATNTLKDYLVKGFVLDDERFKAGKDDAYFEELLARIRDIRSSEKVFCERGEELPQRGRAGHAEPHRRCPFLTGHLSLREPQAESLRWLADLAGERT